MENKESDVRSTPQEFFDYWNNILRFDTDVCANLQNHKCSNYFTIQDDGLSKRWGKVNWCNPPYSRGQIEKWLKKAIEEQSLGNTTLALIPGDTSTSWYQDYVLATPNTSILPVRGRLKFENSKSGAKFCSHVVIYWGLIDHDNTAKSK